MSKQTRIIDSLGESRSQNRSKSPQRSTSPNTSSHNYSSITKMQKDQIHPINKISSSSLLKKKSLKRIKATSPFIQKSPSTANLGKNAKALSMLSKKPSLKYIENLPVISSGITSSYRSLTPNKLGEVDPTTSRKKVQSYALVFEKYEMYKGIFEEIIQKDKTFSMILRKIKDIYEEFYELSIGEQTNKFKEKIESLNEDLKKKNEEISSLDRRVRKLSTENYELARSLERSEEICNGIQSRLAKISKFSLDGVEKTDETWKSLIIENEAYSISFKNLEKKIRNLKGNERKLKRLLIDIKKTGFPVEELYEKTEQKGKRVESGSVTSDSGCLVSNRFQEVEKPEAVPELDLGKVESESFTSNGSYSSSNESF